MNNAYILPSPIYIVGPACYVPPRKITNEDLIEWLGIKMRSDWFVQRTGIEQRFWASEDQAVSDLAINCVNELLNTNDYNKENISRLILATISGNFLSPPTSPLIQEALKLQNIGCHDLGAACSGFTTAIESAVYSTILTQKDTLVIASDIRSKFLSKNDLSATALFGDGATCCILSTTKYNDSKIKILATQLFTDGTVADMISIKVGGSRTPFTSKHYSQDDLYLRMHKGATLFVKAVDGMVECSKIFLNNIKEDLSKIKWFIPHQANLLLITEVAKRLHFPLERTIQTVVQYGNTSSSSTGIGLDHLLKNYPVTSGDKILMTAAGGGGLASCILLEAL